jgi:hypothetical protein
MLILHIIPIGPQHIKQRTFINGKQTSQIKNMPPPIPPKPHLPKQLFLNRINTSPPIQIGSHPAPNRFPSILALLKGLLVEGWEAF